MTGRKSNAWTLSATRLTVTPNSVALTQTPLRISATTCLRTRGLKSWTSLTSPPKGTYYREMMTPSYSSGNLSPSPRRLCHYGRRSRPPLDDPVRIYMPLLARPWIMYVCHADASCHRGATRTLKMLERFCWWVDMEACYKWWVRRCRKCQARKTSRQTNRWPTLSIPLSNSPGISVGIDYFGPLPVTARGNSYILLFTDCFSR